jgi:hypothetical protein
MSNLQTRLSSRETTLGAIQNARKHYIFGKHEPAAKDKPLMIFRRDAAAEYIQSRENFINGPHADADAIDTAIQMGMVKNCPTSGRKYIQLA